MHWVGSWNPTPAMVIQGHIETPKVCSQTTGAVTISEKIYTPGRTCR